MSQTRTLLDILPRSIVNITVDYLRPSHLPTSTNLFLTAGEADYFVACLDDKTTEKQARQGLAILHHLGQLSNPPIEAKLDPSQTIIQRFHSALTQINAAEWLRKRLKNYNTPSLSPSDVMKITEIEDETVFRFFIALCDQTQAAIDFDHLREFLRRKQFELFKYFIECGMRANFKEEAASWTDRTVFFAHLCRLVAAKNRYDILEITLKCPQITAQLQTYASSSIITNLLALSNKLQSRPERMQIAPLASQNLTAILNNLRETNPSESQGLAVIYSTFMEHGINERNPMKVMAVAKYKHHRKDILLKAIQFALNTFDAELYNELISTLAFTLGKQFTFSTETDLGFIDHNTLVKLLKSPHQDARKILLVLDKNIYFWGTEYKPIQNLINEKNTSGKTNFVTKEVFFRELYVICILEHAKPQSEIILQTLLMADEAGLFNEQYFTSWKSSHLLKLTLEEQRTKLADVLLSHRKKIVAKIPAITTHDSKDSESDPLNQINPKKHFGDVPIESFIEKVPEIEDYIYTFSCVFYHCIGNPELEKRLVKRLHLQDSKNEGRTVLHSLAENGFLCVTLIQQVIRLIERHHLNPNDYLQITDERKITPVDVACKAANPKTLAALFSNGKRDHQFRSISDDKEKKPFSPIDLVLEGKDIEAKNECLAILFSNSSTVRQYYVNLFGKAVRRIDLNDKQSVAWLIALEFHLTNENCAESQLNALIAINYFINKGFITLAVIALHKVNFTAAEKGKLSSDGSAKIIDQISEIPYILTATKKIFGPDLVNLYMRGHYFNQIRFVAMQVAAYECIWQFNKLTGKALSFNMVDDDLKTLAAWFSSLSTRIKPAHTLSDLCQLLRLKYESSLANMTQLLCTYKPASEKFLITFVKAAPLDFIKLLIESGAELPSFLDNRVECNNFFENLFARIMNTERFDLLDSLFKSKYFKNLLTTESFTFYCSPLLNFIHELHQKRKFAPLLLLVDKLRNFEGVREFRGDFYFQKIFSLFKAIKTFNTYAESKAQLKALLEEYAADPYKHLYFNSWPMCYLLELAVLYQYGDIIALIHKCRHSQQPMDKPINIRRFMIQPMIQPNVYSDFRPLSLSAALRAEENIHIKTPPVKSVEALIKKLPDNAGDISAVMQMFYYAYGYSAREDLLREHLLKADKTGRTAFHYLASDRSAEATLAMRILITYLLPETKLAFNEDQKAMTPIHYVAANADIKKLELLGSLDFDIRKKPTPVDCLYESPYLTRPCMTYLSQQSKSTREYLFQRYGFQSEIALSELQLQTIIEIDISLARNQLFKVSRSAIELLRTDQTVLAQTIAIKAIEFTNCTTLSKSNECLYGVASFEVFCKHGEQLPAAQRELLTKGLLLAKAKLPLTCDAAISYFTKLSALHPKIAKEALCVLTVPSDSKIDNATQLMLLNNFVVTAAMICRNALTNGKLWRGAHEKIAQTNIDPFVEKVKKLMLDAGGVEEKLQNLKVLVNNLDAKNILRKEFDSYRSNLFFSGLCYLPREKTMIAACL